MRKRQEGTIGVHIRKGAYDLLCDACEENEMSKLDMLTKIILDHFLVEIMTDDLDESEGV